MKFKTLHLNFDNSACILLLLYIAISLAYTVSSRKRSNHLLPAMKSMALVRINGKYRLQSRIACGSFSKSKAIVLHLSYLIHECIGETYLARDILSGKDIVIKLEPVRGEQHTIAHEFHFYKKLGRGTGIHLVHWFGIEGGFNIMAMDRLGLTLNDLFVHCHFHFSVKTVSLPAHQLVSKYHL